MKNKIKNFAVLTFGFCALACLSGCSFSNYQKFERGFFTTEKGGYSDYQVSENQFCVCYTGDKNDSADIVNVFGNKGMKIIRKRALHRAAEVTRDHGFRYFIITSEKEGSVPGGGLAARLRTVALNITCFADNPPSDAYDTRNPLLYQD